MVPILFWFFSHLNEFKSKPILTGEGIVITKNHQDGTGTWPPSRVPPATRFTRQSPAVLTICNQSSILGCHEAGRLEAPGESWWAEGIGDVVGQPCLHAQPHVPRAAAGTLPSSPAPVVPDLLQCPLLASSSQSCPGVWGCGSLPETAQNCVFKRVLQEHRM